jgi:elongation factor P
MRMLYREGDHFIFMHDETFEQVSIPLSIIGDKEPYLMEETVYDIILYKGSVVDVIPPTFLNMKITETSPRVRGDTSGRVLKPAITQTGAKIQIPIFIDEGEVVKVDTRTGEYAGRV